MNNMEEDTIDLLELARAIWKNILAIALVAGLRCHSLCDRAQVPGHRRIVRQQQLL